MKKLMKVSLVAMFVAVPMIASAATVPVAYVGGATVDAQTGQLSAVTASPNVASTSYVKGAYNELAQAINTVATTAAGGQTAQQVQTAITNAAGTTTSTSLSGSNGVLTVEVDGDHVTRDSTTGALTLSAGDIASLGKADQAATDIGTMSNLGTTASDLVGAINEVDTDVANVVSGTTNISYDHTASGLTATTVKGAIDELAAGAAAGATALQSSDLDNTTIEKDSTNGVQVKAGSIGTTQLASGVVTSLGLADSALQKSDITTGSAAGTIAVDGTDVAVNGVLTDATAFDAAGAATAAETAAKAYVDQKLVTVHTTWGNDNATLNANALVNTPAQNGGGEQQGGGE